MEKPKEAKPKKPEELKKGITDNSASHKPREFARFCLWLVMPTMFKGKEQEKLQTEFFIDDEEMHELCQIKTMAQFAEIYGVHAGTLSEWKQKAKKTDLFMYIKEWTRTVSKNVVASTYRSAMAKDPKAHLDRKLMLQLAGWSEENTTNIRFEGLTDMIKAEVAERKRLREEREAIKGDK